MGNDSERPGGARRRDGRDKWGWGGWTAATWTPVATVMGVPGGLKREGGSPRQ